MKIAITHVADAPVSARHPRGYATTGTLSARTVSPEGFGLWLSTLDFDEGATVELPESHGDEAMFVVAGALRAPDGTEEVGPEATLVVESGVATTVQAVGDTRVVHMGPADTEPPARGRLGPPDPGGHGLHWIGPRGRWYFGEDDDGNAGEGGRYYADGSCATCRLSLHLMHHRAGFDQEPHSHSEDELLHVLEGSIAVGCHVIGPGDTLAIGGDVRYRFRSTDGFVLINYRRDASVMSFPDGRPTLVEGAAAHGLPER